MSDAQMSEFPALFSPNSTIEFCNVGHGLMVHFSEKKKRHSEVAQSPP